MKYRGRVKVTGKRQITLPSEMCRELGIDEGDFLEIERVDGEMRLRPIETSRVFSSDDPIFDLIGACDSGEAGNSARDHDRWIADEAGRHNR